MKKPFTRGFNFFYWSYIHGVKCKEVDGVFYQRGKCWASHAKKESYTLECVLEPSVSTYLISVRYAHCTCTAGVAGSCHHLVALLLSVEHCAKTQQDAPEEQTCTTAPQRWGPRPRQVVAQPVSSLVIERAKAGKEDSECVCKASSLYRGERVPSLSGDSLCHLIDDLSASSRSVPLLSVVPQDGSFHECQSSMGPVPFGSVLSYQLLPQDHLQVPAERKQSSTSQSSFGNAPVEGQSPPIHHTGPLADGFCSLPLPKAAAVGDQYAQPVLLSRAIAVERRTRSQATSELWRQLRKKTLTSSKFHLITYRTEVDSAFIQRLFEDQDLSRVPAIAHGQLWEETARLDYVERMKGTGHPDIQVRRYCTLHMNTLERVLMARSSIQHQLTAAMAY